MADSVITKLAAKPLSHQVGILALVGAVLFGLYYQVRYSSMGEDLASAEQRYTRLEKDSEDLKRKEVEWKQMFKEKESLDVRLSTNQVSLPHTAALPSFIGNLQRQAAVSGVSFKKWSRMPEVAAGGYVKVPVAIEVVGGFHQILKYFYLLGKTKRIITIENFELTPETANSDEVFLTASFMATTFRQPDGAAPTKAETKPKSMKQKVKDAKELKEKRIEKATNTGVNRLKNAGAN